MSEIADTARVAVFIADHATSETGKINALGVGWQVTGLQPNGRTPAHTLVILVDLPQKYAGEQFPVTVALHNSAGDIVKAAIGGADSATTAGFAGLTAAPVQPLRIAQLVKADKPAVPLPGVVVAEGLPCRVQIVLNLANGLPLEPGEVYTWRVEIDSNSRPDWQATFHVLAPPAGPVFG